MPIDRAALEALAIEVARFYVRDRSMSRAQASITARLADGKPISERAAAGYLKAVRRYFGGFEREARAHLADIDRRLAHVSQLQYNLTAERSVTARRVEVTQAVLARVPDAGRE